MSVEILIEESARPALDVEDPWPGLDSFHEFDSFFFKGRLEDAVNLAQRIIDTPVTVLYGVSGIGKSSLLEAGVFPLLRKENCFPVRIRFDFAERQANLTEQVRHFIEVQATAWEVEAPDYVPRETLWEYFHHRGSSFWDDRNRLVLPVLVFDQFEELFTRGAEPPSRKQATTEFLTQLADLAQGRVPEVLEARLENREQAGSFDILRHHYRIVISLRQDFLAALNDLPDVMPSKANCRSLAPMSGSAALEVVRVSPHLISPENAERVVRFVAKTEREESLADAIVDPALLSVVCRELNHKRRERGDLEIQGDLLEGSRDEILDKFYERAMQDATPAMRTFVEESLILDSGTGATVSAYRNTFALLSALRMPGLTEDGFDRLVDRRLIRIEPRGNVKWVELTHDLLVGVVKNSRDKRRDQERANEEKRSREAAENEARKAEAKKVKELWEEAENERVAKEAKRNLIIACVFGSLAVLLIALCFYVWRLRENLEEAIAIGEVENAEALSIVDKPTEALAHAGRAIASNPTLLTAKVLLAGLLLRGNVSRFVFLADDRVRSAKFGGGESKWVVTTSYGNTVQLWNAATGEPVGKAFENCSDAAVSSDGKWLVTTSSHDNTAQVWWLDSLPIRKGSPLQNSIPMNTVVISPDGAWIVTASENGTAQVWNSTGKKVNGQIRHWAGKERRGLFTPSFSPDSKWVITASSDKTAQVWECATGKAVGEPLNQGSSVYDAVFSPNGQQVATGGGDGTAQIWELPAGAPMRKEPLKHFVPNQQSPAPISKLAFSPDGKRLATASVNHTAEVWEISTGNALLKPAAEPGPFGNLIHQGAIEDIEFSPDGSQLVTASDDGTAQVWNTKTGERIGFPMRHMDKVYHAMFSPHGNFLLTASADRTAREWRRVSDEEVSSKQDEGSINSATLSKDGRLVVTASERRLQIWNAADLTESSNIPGAHLRSAAFSSNGEWVAAGTTDGSVQMWKMGFSAGRELAVRPGKPVNDIEFSPGDKLMATANDDGSVQIWEWKNAQPVLKWTLKHYGPVRRAVFSPDGQGIVTASEDGSAEIWGVSSGQSAFRLEHEGRVYDAAFSPDGRLVATACSDSTAQLWDAKSGKKAGSPLWHRAPVVGVAFSPHGDLLVTTSEDNNAQIWEVSTGKALGPPMIHTSRVHWATFADDDRWVFTLSDKGGLKKWPIQIGDARNRTWLWWANFTHYRSPEDQILIDLATNVSGYSVAVGSLPQLTSENAGVSRLRLREAARGQATQAAKFVKTFLFDP